MADYDFLDSERKKLWSRILELEDAVKKKSSDHEKDAKESSRKAAEFRNKAEARKLEADAELTKIKEISDQISKSGISQSISEIKDYQTYIESKKTSIDASVERLEGIFDNFNELSEKVDNLVELAETTEENQIKIDSLISQITKKNDALNKVYIDIFGSSITDPNTGGETKIVGKKAELENAFKTLKSEFENYTDDKRQSFDQILEQFKKAYENAANDINALLPQALTAGLSHAYSTKKNGEETEIKELKKQFKNWILFLIAISLIPFGISIYMLIWENVPLKEVIQQLPSIVYPMVMLYVPPLWIAISTNKKINLSKRLIEEYTHKEVVTKTFEGLSKQIEGIKDPKVSAELKNKLLRNILEISEENPGKLLLDYNNSDHPILDRVTGTVKEVGSTIKSVTKPSTPSDAN